MKNYYPFDQVSIDPTGVQIPVSAPGKVILNGEHSVVHGKLALAASINLRTQLSISEITLQNTLIVQYHVFKFAYRFDLQQIKELLLKEPLPLLKDQKEYNLESPALLDHEALLNRVEDFLTLSQCTFSSQIEVVAVKAFFYLLTGILGSVNVNLTPILIDCTSELNPGTGLGSSASFAVCIAAALVQYVKTKTTGGDISRECYKPCVWDSNPPTSIEKELDLICRWGYNAEKIIHGTPSGLDNTICTYGSVVEFRRGTAPKLMGTSCALNLLLINSNVPRETKKLVAKVAVYRQKYPEIVDPILEAMDALSKKVLEKILALNEPSGTDNIPEIYSSLGELYTINHNLLNAIGVGHKKLNEIVDILADNGLSGKLTGGGGGGYAICLIPPDFDPARLETTIKSLKLCGFDVVKTDLGGEGVRLENSLK